MLVHIVLQRGVLEVDLPPDRHIVLIMDMLKLEEPAVAEQALIVGDMDEMLTVDMVMLVGGMVVMVGEAGALEVLA
jgi:hypothetical protein